MRNIFFVMLLFIGALFSTAGAFDRTFHHAERVADYPGLRIATLDAGSRISRSASQAVTGVLLSESTSPARFDQNHADIAAYADGSFLMVWDDNRNGSRKIFRQRLNSLTEIVDSNVLVAGSSTGANFIEPIVKIDTLLRVHVYYRDQAAGLIYGIRFNADLTVDLPPFLVNDTTQNSFAGPFDIDIYPDGRTVVAWENYDLQGSTIAARVISATGSFVTGALTVNSDGGGASHWVPSVDVEPSSGFLVAWEDYRNTNADIYAQLYAGAGTKLGGNFAIVPTPNNSFDQYAPEVANLGLDRYVISWLDLRSGQEVYLQEYNTNSGLVGSNELVSNGGLTELAWDTDLSVSSSGNLVVAWAAFGAQSRILSRAYENDLSAIGPPEVRNVNPTDQRWGPSVRHVADTSYALAWTEVDNDNQDIALTVIDTSGAGLVGETIINDDQVGAVSSSPAVKTTSGWYNVVAYADQRRDVGDIFVRGFTRAGNLLGASVRANQDSSGSLQGQPSVAVDYDSEVLVTWLDSRVVGGLSGQRVFGRFADKWGSFIGNEFIVSDSLQSASKSAVRAAYGTGGDGLVIWLDKRSGDWAVYGRWFTSSHQPDGAEFLVSAGDDILTASLSIACSDAGSYMISWVDLTTPSPRIEARWYHADKSFGGSFNHTPTVAGVTLVAAAGAARANNQGVLWTGLDQNSKRVLYFTELDTSGNLVANSVQLTDAAGAEPTNPAVAIDEQGRVVASWVDRREGKRQVYYTLLNSSLSPIMGNEPIANADPELMQSPTVTASHGTACIGWVDPRENGMNIYAGLVAYDPTDVGGGDPSVVPSEYTLSQNYPNPFNPTTEISFALPSAGDVELSVFNILGQKIRMLVNQSLPAGSHEVTWQGTADNGQPVASGVYFYRLTSGDVKLSRKMMLLK